MSEFPSALSAVQSAVGLAGVEFHEEIDSTNTRGLQLLANGHDRFPWLVLAERQTAGRGRGGNRWWSADGSLTFSLLLDRDQVEPARRAQLSLAVGIGLCRAVESLVPGLPVRLKWPNDLYVEGRKLCGILVEAPQGGAAGVVIGVGLNVNNSFALAPSELQTTATSLSDCHGHALDREAVLSRSLSEILQAIGRLDESPELLQEEWASRCYLAGRIVHLETPRGRTIGLCLGIDSDGALLLQSENGPSRHTSGVVAKME